MRRAPILVLAAALAGCSSPPKSNVLSTLATAAAWTANGRVVYSEPVSGGTPKSVIRLYDPASGERSLNREVFGEVLFIDADDTDRILLGGVGGAYSVIRQTGDVLYTITSVPDASDGYVALHLSASGTLLALATHPPMPDLQVHRVPDAGTEQNFVDVEGTAQIRELDWSPDDQFIYYAAGDPTGATPDRIVKISSTNAASRQTIFQDAAIPFLNRVFVSNDGATLLVSGEDADGKTAVWTLPSAGGTPVKIAEEGGSRLTVRAASGPSPDGTRFVMFATTARGTVLTVEPLEPL